jgi:hypothetical protein
LGFLPDEEHNKLDQSTIEVKRMLAGLIRRLRPIARELTEC